MSPTSPWQPGAGAVRQPPTNAACKVHRDSHSIHKQAASSPPSSSSTNSSVSSSSTNRPRQKQPQQQPVIIYTHSPKVIHTNPRDFMSIVQKLTGLDSPASAHHQLPRNAAAQEESSSSSSESCANANANAHAHAAPPHPYADHPHLMPPPAAPLDAHFMAPPPDIPLFAPGASSDLKQLCAPRGLYGQFPPLDAAALGGPVMSTNMNGAAGNVFSPSVVDAMRTFPDY